MQSRVEQRSTELQERLRQREEELLGRSAPDHVGDYGHPRRDELAVNSGHRRRRAVAAADPALNITARVRQRLRQAQ